MSAGPIDNVDEITHESVVKETVIKVATDPCGKEAEGNVNNPSFVSTEKKYGKNDQQRGNRDAYQQGALAGRYSKGGAGVFSGHNCEETFYDSVAFAGFAEPGEDSTFAPNIQHKPGNKQRPEDEMCRERRQNKGVSS